MSCVAFRWDVVRSFPGGPTVRRAAIDENASCGVKIRLRSPYQSWEHIQVQCFLASRLEVFDRQAPHDGIIGTELQWRDVELGLVLLAGCR